MTYRLNHQFFSELNEKTMYWGGFLAADGNIDRSKPRITLALKSSDSAHLEKFAKDLSFEGEVKSSSYEDNRSQFKTGKYYKSTVRFTSLEIAKDLNNHFLITANKSKTLQFPKHLEDHPLINHYIRGLIDGDGSILYKFEEKRSENCATIFLCGTEDVVSSVNRIIKSRLDISGDQKVNGRGLNLLYYRGHQNLKKLINFLYCDATTFLDRKWLAAQEILKIKSKKVQIEKQTLLSLKETGASIKEMSALLECSTATVSRSLKKFNLMPYSPNSI